MNDRLDTIAAILRTNEQVFHNAIADVTESAWLHRPGDSNHLAFLATHLVAARHYTVRSAGGTSTDPTCQKPAYSSYALLRFDTRCLSRVLEVPPG